MRDQATGKWLHVEGKIKKRLINMRMRMKKSYFRLAWVAGFNIFARKQMCDVTGTIGYKQAQTVKTVSVCKNMIFRSAYFREEFLWLFI